MSNFESDLSGIKHATAIVNPASTRNQEGVRLLHRLFRSTKLPITHEFTTPDKNQNVTKILAALKREANEGAIIIVSGDGFFNLVVDTIIANGIDEAHKLTPLWSIGGGNADDGVHAKHTRLHRKHPELVFRDGRIVEVNPIRFDILKPDETEPTIRSAAFYATLGATALASSELYLNSPKHRKGLGSFQAGRWASEWAITSLAILDAGMNKVRDDTGEHSFFDLQFANSHIMAKYLQFPTYITDEKLFCNVVQNKSIPTLGKTAVQLLRGREQGSFLEKGESVYFETAHDTWAQFDGEAEVIPEGSNVTVGLSEQAVRLVISNPLLLRQF